MNRLKHWFLGHMPERQLTHPETSLYYKYRCPTCGVEGYQYRYDDVIRWNDGRWMRLKVRRSE